MIVFCLFIISFFFSLFAQFSSFFVYFFIRPCPLSLSLYIYIYIYITFVYLLSFSLCLLFSCPLSFLLTQSLFKILFCLSVSLSLYVSFLISSITHFLQLFNSHFHCLSLSLSLSLSYSSFLFARLPSLYLFISFFSLKLFNVLSFHFFSFLSSSSDNNY